MIRKISLVTSIVLTFLMLLLNVCSMCAYAGGGMAHMFLAQEAIDLLPDESLRKLLKNNLETYLVGAYYPDSGYISGNHYGEDSHWDPFVFAFADYIKETYPHPEISNPKLVAFLFGCAVHRLSDEIMHWTFYPIAAKRDLNSNDWESFHGYGDIGIDLLLTLDKAQWLTHPATWWIPVRDLVAVYHRMGKDEYTAAQIIWGNSITYLAGFGERFIAAPAYPYLRTKIAWSAAHYYDWPEGGILTDEKKSAAYLMQLWERLKRPTTLSSPTPRSIHEPINKLNSHGDTSLTQFAQQVLAEGVVSMPVVENEDGSVELQSPVINSFLEFQKAMLGLITKVTHL